MFFWNTDELKYHYMQLAGSKESHSGCEAVLEACWSSLAGAEGFWFVTGYMMQ